MAVGGVNYAGEPLKQFHELSDKIQAGWQAAAPAPLELSEHEWQELKWAMNHVDAFWACETKVNHYSIMLKLAGALRIRVE